MLPLLNILRQPPNQDITNAVNKITEQSFQKHSTRYVRMTRVTFKATVTYGT